MLINRLKKIVKKWILKFLWKIDGMGFLIFWISRIKNSISISDSPMLSKEKIEYLGRLAEKSSQFLEFGSGSSTLFIAKKCENLVTVESDRLFLKAVKEKSLNLNLENILFLYAKIGPVTSFGQPWKPFRIFYKSRYCEYPELPWKHLGNQYKPDAILIDGRFRVSCFLEVALNCSEIDPTIIIDDFKHRAEYQEILKYASIREYIGDAIVVRLKNNDKHKLLEAKKLYRFDFS